MDCEAAQDLLGPYVDNELSLEARVDLEDHLASCLLCSEELNAVRELVAPLSAPASVQVPDELWSSIEARLDEVRLDEVRPERARTLRIQFYKRPPAIAASIILVIGVGLIASLWSGDASRVEASTVDFGVLLDALPFDADRALQKFLMKYDAREVSPSKAREAAPELNFALPDRLADDYQLGKVYVLRFGDRPGIAARYATNGKFMATIFHSAVAKEDYGGRKDHSCVVGKGHGHKVEVGDWRLVHLTDRTTCHCVLSQLDEKKELPAVMDAIAPQFVCNCGCQG